MDYILKRPSSEPGHSRPTLFLWSVVFPLTDHLDKRYIIIVGTSQSGRASSVGAPKHTSPAHLPPHWLISEAPGQIPSSYWLERAPLVRWPLPCLTRAVRGCGQDRSAGAAGNRSNHEVRQVYHEKCRSGQCAQTYRTFLEVLPLAALHEAVSRFRWVLIRRPLQLAAGWCPSSVITVIKV